MTVSFCYLSDKLSSKLLFCVFLAYLNLLQGCRFQIKGPDSAQSKSAPSIYGESQRGIIFDGQEISVQAGDITFLLRETPLSLASDLDSLVKEIRSTAQGEKKLYCAQTIEIVGLFLCIGSVEAAHHGPLNRAAIFAEGRPAIGVPNSGSLVSWQKSLEAWPRSGGHDIPQAQLETFFSASKSQCITSLDCFSPYEFKFAIDIMPQLSRLAPMGYSIISMDTESETSLENVKKHEIAHGQFFQQQGYRAAVYQFWNSLPPHIKNAAATMLSDGYDVKNELVLINEFHAFVLDRTYEKIPAEAPPQFQILRTNAQELRNQLIYTIRYHGMPIWSDQL